KDGNHRVSVARERGQEYIDAEVIEGHIRAPFYAEMEPNEMLLQAEYAEFLRRTDLDRLEPDHDIRPSALGRYDEIWEHILGHRNWLAAIRHEPVSDREAVADWYQHIYCPIIDVARAQGLTDRFPNHTEADVYLWVMRHRWEIERDLGHDVGPVSAAEDFAETAQPPTPVDRVADALRGLLALPERILNRGE
ncbi:MAG: transcriptional regulator, partial [Chloroflexia bacterium]|nr:transcriptional regulator [Chloroflexia bacterium]